MISQIVQSATIQLATVIIIMGHGNRFSHKSVIYHSWAYRICHTFHILCNQIQNHSYENQNMNICINIPLNYCKISKMNHTNRKRAATKMLSMNFVVFMMISLHVFVSFHRLRVKNVYHQPDHMFCFWSSTICVSVKQNDWIYKNLRYVAHPHIDCLSLWSCLCI